MDRMRILTVVPVAACALLVSAVFAGETDGCLPLAGCKVTAATHPEHPGAAGEVIAEDGGWRLRYDFSNGGHAMGMVVEPPKPVWAETIEFEAKHADRQAICLIVRDATDQSHRAVARPHPGEWRKYAFSMRGDWIGHWGGARDGIVHQPIKSVEVNLDRAHKATKDPTDRGEAFVRNIGYLPAKKDEWAVDGEGLRYLVTDFRPGDVFSAGPRAFFRSDLQSRFDGGELEIDFSRAKEMTLFSEIPVWGVPEEFLLTVEAPAESAGLELEVHFRAGLFRRRVAGRLREVTGGARIYQTFSIPGFLDKGWSNFGKGSPESMPRSKRFMRLVIRRGGAPAKKLRVKPVRLEAVVRAGVSMPPLVAVPPKGDEPPTSLEVGHLNLMGVARTDAKVKVTVSDWSGRELGTVVAPLKPVRPGERGFAHVVLPPVKDRVNFLSYCCELLKDGRRDRSVGRWTTSWTRPLADAGSAEKNPDSPWGFGVYIHRSEDRYAYFSGYASPTNAAALAEMEKRAALARAAGIKWDRAEFKPSQANPAKGRYDFSYYDRLFEIADRNGISCLGLWSHYFPSYDKHYTQECYDDYVGTLRVAAARYRGRITAWEIWNEPNISFWTGPKEDYPKLVDACWDVLKASDPTNRVVAFSMAGLGTDFIDMCLGKGVKFDDISIHPYRAEPDERTFLADLASITNRSRGTPLWLTEMGWPTGCDQSTYSEIQQAAYYARAYLTAAGSGMVHSIYGYNFIDDGFNVAERENNFGVLRRDLTPKPAYRAIAKVCRTFDRGKATLEAVPVGKGEEVWVFRMGGKSAVWSRHGMRLKIRTDGVAHATNLMDEPVGAPSAETTLTVGPEAMAFFDRNVLSVEGQ